ncbi:MAG: hypothetical protein IKK46_02425 [Clostridia bacterium]|nr:hypothetical protein [Clostridia bacterium]
MQNEKLYILTYEHGGYVLWKDEVKPRLLKIFDWLEKYPKLRIGLDYESFTFDEFSKCDKEVVDLIKKLLEKYPDRVGLGATTYGQPLSLTINDESNARQLSYAVKTNLKYFNKTPDVYAISEFALNNQTPQLISLCGYKAALLRSHVMGYGYPKTYDSSWGKWIGKDGTEIPAVPTYDKQGRGYNCTTVDNWILSRWPVDSDLYSLEDFREMFKKYSPLLASRYDDLTQPIEEITAEIEKHDDYEYALLEDIPSIYGEPKDEYKTTDNDFHVQMPWGYCGNEIFNGCRQGEVNAVEAERLNALSVMLGGKSLEEKSEEAWKYILAAEHHDVTICGLLDLSRRFIPTSLNASQYVKNNSLEFIKEKFTDKNDYSVIVINHHSFDICENLEISVENDVAVFDGDKKLECEIIEKNGKKTLKFLAEVSPFTIKRFTLKNIDIEENKLFFYNEGTCELTTPCYKIKLTENGIAYIKDIKTEKTIFGNNTGELFTGNINGVDSISKGEWQVEVHNNSAVATQKGEIGSIPFEFTMNFSGKSRRIDCKSRFTMNNELVGRTDVTQGRPVPFTLNGHHHEDKLCLSLNVNLSNNRKMFRDLPYSISEWNGALRKTEKYWYPNDDILIDVEVSPEESFNNTTYFHGIYWLCLRDNENGLAVFNKGCMGAALNGNHLLIPLIYSNEYMCGTRIIEGEFENEFAIMPFSSEMSNIDLHKAALCYVQPPVALTAPKGNGNLSDATFFDYKTENQEIILTALYPENDYLLARFCNYSDENSSAEISSVFGEITTETDLLGNELKPVTKGKLEFHPWEIKTVKIVRR